MPILYRKTAKGLAEIETRAHRLPPRTRSALILVDGKRSDDELRRLLQQGADEALDALLAGGFIESGGAAPAMAPPPMPVQGAARPAPVSLEALRREAAHLLTDQVGPLGDPVAIRIERSKTAAELRAAVALATQILLNTRGRAAAETYAARFAGL